MSVDTVKGRGKDKQGTEGGLSVNYVVGDRGDTLK